MHSKDLRILAEEFALSVIYRISIGEAVPASEITAARTGLADAITAAKCTPRDAARPLDHREILQPARCPECESALLGSGNDHIVVTLDEDGARVIDVEVGCAECGERTPVRSPNLAGCGARLLIG